MSVRMFTEKPLTNHISGNKSHVTNNEAAENVSLRIQQKVHKLGENEDGRDWQSSLFSTARHLIIHY